MLTCTGIMAVMAPLGPKMIEPMLDGAPMPEGLTVGPIDWVMIVVGLVLTLSLLFGGIFCVMRNPTARLLILIWAIPSIPFSLFNYMHQMDKQASVREWAKQYPDTEYARVLAAQGAQAQQIGEIIGLVMTIALGVVIPAFFIIWFGLIKTKPEQMTGTNNAVV